MFASRLVSTTAADHQAHVEAPKKFERTPIGRLEESETLKRRDKSDDEEAPRRRMVNPETGEIGGPRGPEPTRYGDWEQKGRCTDF